MKKLLMLTALVVFTLVVWVSSSRAGEIDILLQKLVEKGVLTPGEAQQIGTETKEQVKADIAAGKFSSLPSWVQNTKLKGDFRMRYQTEKKQSDSDQKERPRIRMRLGMESKVNDQTKVYFGLASGSSADNRSTNQNFANSFEKKSIWIDYAYVSYAPAAWAALQAGRMANPIWRPSDLLWDSDINPEGGSVALTKTLNPSLDLFINTAYFHIDEDETGTADPNMVVAQPGFKWNISESVSLKNALSYYWFNSVKNQDLDYEKNTNSQVGGVADGLLLYDYDAWVLSSELGIAEPKLISAWVPYLALFGDYVNNTDPSDANTGWLAGLKFGNKKVANFGEWQFKYQYRKLEKDAWLDIFPDSDAYGGSTNIKGHEAVLTYGLNKNCSLDLDYYVTDLITGTKNKEKLFQADLNFKF
ncbi:MAG: putative porin [Candidatus Omnitrophota bacterium]|jgi:hypothetical protein